MVVDDVDSRSPRSAPRDTDDAGSDVGGDVGGGVTAPVSVRRNDERHRRGLGDGWRRVWPDPDDGIDA
jgi:hypothetical protein